MVCDLYSSTSLQTTTPPISITPYIPQPLQIILLPSISRPLPLHLCPGSLLYWAFFAARSNCFNICDVFFVYKVKPADAPSKIAANVNWIGIIAALEDVDTDCAWGSLGALGEGVDVHVLASVMIMMFCDQGHKNSTYAENLHLKRLDRSRAQN